MNQIMNNKFHAVDRHLQRAALSASVALIMAMPVQAGIAIPNKPLESGVAVPPNVMLILDTSGSMGYRSHSHDF